MRTVFASVRERARRWNLFLLFTATLLLTACSTRMVYNYLDWIIPWYAEDYIDLTSAQKDNLEQQVAILLEWHRREELPKYVTLLEQLRQTLRQERVTPDDIDYYVVQVQNAWNRIVIKTTPALTSVVQTLSDEQVDQLMSKLRKSEEKQLARYAKMSVMKQRARSYNKMSEALEKWIGPMTPQQERMVGTWSQRRPITTDDWLDYRTVWNAGLDELLAQRNQGIFMTRFQPLLLEEGEYALHRYKQVAVPESIRFTVEFMAELHATLTEQQRKRLDSKIKGYIDDFRYLSRS